MQQYNKAIWGFLSTVAANVMATVMNDGDIYDPRVWLIAGVAAVAVGGVVYQVPNKRSDGSNVR